MKITISKRSGDFIVDPVEQCGAAFRGYGRTMDAAIASFVRYYQKDLGLDITVDGSALPAEMARRRRELSKR